jgi:hypothetical protein
MGSLLLVEISDFRPSSQSIMVSLRQLVFTSSVVPNSPILVTPMKEALSSSETSVLTRATWRIIQ